MGSWREVVLQKFFTHSAKLIVVRDPDQLLLDQMIVEKLQKEGYHILPYTDYAEFRYLYELKFRKKWDSGYKISCIVTLHSDSLSFQSLPYDILQIARKITISVDEIFPYLSYSVVASLDKSYYERIYKIQKSYLQKPLSDNETKEFLLKYVFNVEPDLIQDEKDLLQFLIRRHYQGIKIPRILDDYLIEDLQKKSVFNEWPLQEIIPDKESFFLFLQERWPFFVKHFLNRDYLIREEAFHFKVHFSGPRLLPFDHPDIRVYIDNLFLEGFLKPVKCENIEKLRNTWVSAGVITSRSGDLQRRMHHILYTLESNIPNEDSHCDEWMQFALRWADFLKLFVQLEYTDGMKFQNRIEELKSNIDSIFLKWVFKHYTYLSTLPPTSPVMVHHIPRYLSRRIESGEAKKIAFLLIDGLSLDQWMVIREILVTQNPSLTFKEQTVFAWIPTITSVSRQAAFSGTLPLTFSSNIHTTSKEPHLWRKFWIDCGFREDQVGYIKSVNDDRFEPVSYEIKNNRFLVVGLIIDKIDKIMHGMELGTAGMHNQIRQWIEKGFMFHLIDFLHQQDYAIYLSSDHGNTEAKGIGSPQEGVIAEIRGERVRIYSDRLLRKQIKQRFPDAIEWPPVGLPENYFPLIAPARQAFVQPGKTIVCHGGISLDEVIVPFIQIDRRSP